MTRSDLIDLIDAAVRYARADGMLWSTGYDALRRIAATVGVDADEWSQRQHHLTYVSPRGRRYTAGVVPYAELTDAIKAALAARDIVPSARDIALVPRSNLLRNKQQPPSRALGE